MRDITNHMLVIKDIFDLFHTIGPQIHSKNESSSTQIVKDSFTILGSEYGFITRPNKEQPEYLFDLCWYNISTNLIKSINEVSLIIESEWKKEFYQIQYDFEKLLIANVKYKIMVFQTDEVFENTTSKLKQIISAFKSPDTSTYIFAGFINSLGIFQIEEYKKT